MVIHLFVKKAVPLYIKEKEILTTKKTLQLWQRQKKKQTLRC